ncbi:autotransporter outer membrane beta-barrel domain-containing protein [Xenorhabdus indica]|uniref:autotransporter outer membrane beta-barrel domain-containing protein n=1 Tax=Xenorhabdus indica TaxID=333964 RepID=UPI0016572693|nr:autotransporter domain-containing protein [Xenorhabdus indica]MBC8945128.1 outer membrane esterase [Xenorhabdus indica]
MKKAFLFTPALLALSISTVSNANAYDKIYVFGDSLSDTGNSKTDKLDIERFTTNGKSEQLYAEYISWKLTGSELIPSNKGGTNYAKGGATSIWELNPKTPDNTTNKQVSNYLQSNKRADSNGIYIHWVGGNDLAAALIAGQKDPSIAHDIVRKSASATAKQITQLVDAGAGLVIAPTVPDVGTTPRLLETVLRQGLEDHKIDDATIEYTLKEVHQSINTHDIPSGAARELALQQLFKKLSQNAEQILKKKSLASGEKPLSAAEIEKELTKGYKKASEGATKLTNSYNEIVDDQISQSNGNILRVDINGLLHEVIDNPYIYGIQNTLGYACPQGQSASICRSDKDKDPEFNKDREFLFSDEFHPTPLAHKILGQYIESIYIAPSQVMTLNQVNRTPVKGARASLDGHLQQLRSGGNETGKLGVFGGYSGSRNNTFTLGGDYQLTESLLLGALYSNDKTEHSPASNFTYNGNAHVATAYGLWNVFNNAWLSGDLHYARINYDSLTRSIQLGEATRRESGSTTGKQWGARFAAGWDIPVADVVTTSPIIQFAWDKGDVKGYRESGNNSTSMYFSDQNYTSKVGTLGWRVDTQLGRFNPYASVQFNHQFGDTHFKLRSAINSTATSFVMDSGKHSKNWRQYTVGANANLFGNVRGFASVTRNEGSSQDPHYNFNLGINASF